MCVALSFVLYIRSLIIIPRMNLNEHGAVRYTCTAHFISSIYFDDFL